MKKYGRYMLVVLAVILMGLALSILVKVNLGGDPYTCMNLGISSYLPITFGTWQAILNIILVILVVKWERDQIGVGTLANMFLVGYSMDFFSWLENRWIPEKIYENFLYFWIIALAALILFVFAVALYISCDCGTGPYDALSIWVYKQIVGRREKTSVPFRVVRMAYDFTACVLGFLLGSKVGIVTILIALLLGPATDLVRKTLRKQEYDGGI